MFEIHSVPIEPLSPEEVEALRALGRCPRCFDCLVHDCVRYGFFRASLYGRLDADASTGLDALESDLVQGLAREPAGDEGQLRAKAAVIQAHLDGRPAGDDNRAAILWAALAADAARLGLAPTPAAGQAS